MASAQTFSELAAMAFRHETEQAANKLDAMPVQELMQLNHAAISLKALIGNIYHRKAVEYKESFK